MGNIIMKNTSILKYTIVFVMFFFSLFLVVSSMVMFFFNLVTPVEHHITPFQAIVFVFMFLF